MVCNAVNDSLREYEKRYSPDSFIRFLSTIKRYKCSVTGLYLKAPKENVVRINEWRNPACDSADILDIDIKLADVSGDELLPRTCPGFYCRSCETSYSDIVYDIANLFLHFWCLTRQ